MNKITKTFLYFLITVAICLAETSCQSSRSSYNQRKSATTNKGYVRKKASSGNKRANHSKSSNSRVASRKSSTAKPVYGKRPPSTSDKSPVEVRENKAASVQAKEIIKVARSYIGTPYRYGGSTRRGMDCSGLLYISFEVANIKLPRTSNEQANYGQEVRLANLSPGDLVFFAERKGSNQISHVGMVTEVGGRNEVKFIHASTSRGVIEDNFYSEYYQKIFVKAVRPF